MLEHYQTPAALAALKRLGPLEWEDCGMRIVLCWYGGGFCEIIDPDDDPMISDLPDHVALCVLRNHLREWLERKAVRICVEFTGKSKRGPSSSYHITRELRNEDGYFEGDCDCEVLTVDGWRQWGRLGTKGNHPLYFDDIDQALLAAVKATTTD